MGIHQLYSFLNSKVPQAVRQQTMKSFMGHTIAIDASMSLYAFMVAIRDAEGINSLTNDDGEVTSHISGMLSRATRLMEAGIKPVYVFDGKPPDAKSEEIQKRKETKEVAKEEMKGAIESGDVALQQKLSKRMVTVTKQQNQDVMQLLKLMGIPIIQAPCEAEAQCATMAKEGLVYAVATEDADALTFGAPRVIRSLTVSEARQKALPTCVIDLETILTDLELSIEMFIDFCILCGCDYTCTIKGIGPASAYNLIMKHKDLESILENIDPKKYCVPESFDYEKARNEFRNPLVESNLPSQCVKSKDPDYVGLKEFLVGKHSFSELKVDNMLSRLTKACKGSKQSRLESFFGPSTIRRKALPKATAKAASKRAGGLSSKKNRK